MGPQQISSTPNRRKGVIITISIIGGLGALVAALGMGALGAWIIMRGSQTPQVATQQAPGFDGNTVVSSDESSIENVVKKAAPSVVSIFAYSGSGGAIGTGVILSGDGYIITNKHVVEKGRSFTVITNDGDVHDRVSLIGMDPLNDIAFLKVEGVSNLPEATLGDSSTIRIGQKVVAIGTPHGLKNSVTSGIISGKGRPLPIGDSPSDVQVLSDFLQTDAAINSGNSGGPLLNMAGQVIGINTAMSKGSENIGFSIPINATKGMVKIVKEKGRVERAYAGMRYQEITPETRVTYKLTQKQGALVFGDNPVAPGSPAEKAGVRQGDIITKVNGKTVGEQGGLTSLISEYIPGETVQLTVIRNGSEISLTMTLAAYKE